MQQFAWRYGEVTQQYNGVYIWYRYSIKDYCNVLAPAPSVPGGPWSSLAPGY